jgi:hypothetical protein
MDKALLRFRTLSTLLLAASIGPPIAQPAAARPVVRPDGTELTTGRLHLLHRSPVQNGFVDAVAALEPVAEGGDGLAQYALGVLHRSGSRDLPADGATAIGWFTRAASLGNAGAMRELALTYDKGLGVPADPAAALGWYRQAAADGDALAQLTLGLKLANGQDLRKDTIQAYKWLTLAETGVFFDDERACRALTKRSRAAVMAEMTPAEIGLGDAEVAAFKAQHR